MASPDLIKRLRTDAYGACLAVLPSTLSFALDRMSRRNADFISDLSEIRLRAGGVSSIVVRGENLPIDAKISKDEVSECFSRLTHGALHIHRDTLLRGYISASHGVRVGIVGSARYDQGRLVAIGEVTSLVFRLPFFDYEIGRKIKDATEDGRLHSLLIYSPPSGGKTTALRSLAWALCEQRYTRVVVIDERRELYEGLYEGTGVDILSGFSKAQGIEIATRVLSPEIILVDELSAAEADATRLCALCGVPIVATVHACRAEELYEKRGIAELLSAGVFDYTVGIVRSRGEYGTVVERAV